MSVIPRKRSIFVKVVLGRTCQIKVTRQGRQVKCGARAAGWNSQVGGVCRRHLARIEAAHAQGRSWQGL